MGGVFYAQYQRLKRGERSESGVGEVHYAEKVVIEGETVSACLVELERPVEFEGVTKSVM